MSCSWFIGILEGRWLDEIMTGQVEVLSELVPSRTKMKLDWMRQRLDSESRTFTYDLNGNTTNDGQRSYEWDAENRLVKISYPGTNNYTQFTYDGLSRRVAIKEAAGGSTVSDKRFVWDGLSIAERRAADGTTVERRYYAEGFQEGGAESYYYVRDHLGSIRAVIDEEGEERGRWSYSLWGARGANEITSDPVESDFGYTGHLEHERSGLAFALYRAYAPGIGRWLSRDPFGSIQSQMAAKQFNTAAAEYYAKGIFMAEMLPEGSNPYSYVLNNPINQVDPDGEVIPILPAIILIGGVAISEQLIMVGVSISMEPGTEKTFRSPVCLAGTLMSASGNAIGSVSGGDQPMQMQLQITKDASGVARAKYIFVPIRPGGI